MEKMRVELNAINEGMPYNRWDGWASPDAALIGYFEYFVRAPKGASITDSAFKRHRFFTLGAFLQGVLRSGLEGEVAECGCFEGHSTTVMARCLKHAGENKKLYVFDSFEGIELKEEDVYPKSRAVLEEALLELQSIATLPGGLFAGSRKVFEAATQAFPFIDLRVGRIPERFPEVESKLFCFVHVDVDVYEAVRDSLSFFAPRIVPGGVIWIDDYGISTWPGCSRAVEEFVEGAVEWLHYKHPFGGAALIRRG